MGDHRTRTKGRALAVGGAMVTTGAGILFGWTAVAVGLILFGALFLWTAVDA